MGKQELDNLVKIGTLKIERPSRNEFDGMLESAKKRLADAAHRLALAALRHQGYRSENRITVFQTLAHTLDIRNADIQIFLKAHSERNLAEYEGHTEIDNLLLAELISCTKTLETAVSNLPKPKNS